MKYDCFAVGFEYGIQIFLFCFVVGVIDLLMLLFYELIFFFTDGELFYDFAGFVDVCGYVEMVGEIDVSGKC